jgi:SAM-dependent methyltransferase
LPDRALELPPRNRAVRVAGPEELVRRVLDWFEKNDRRAAAADAVRYMRRADPSEIGRLWEPNAFLAEVLPQLDRGAALDVACGTGRDAVFVASCGWNVTAVDILPDALDRGRELARRCAAAIQPIRWVQADLEGGQVKLAQRFDLITMIRYLHRPLFPTLSEWLNPGGSVICATFTTLHRDRHGRPARDSHVLQLGELPRLLEGFEIRHHSEAWRGDAHTARVWAVSRGAPRS